jgi:hypothetical protein
MSPLMRSTMTFAAVLALSACGSGGGGGGSGVVAVGGAATFVEVPFTSFNAIGPNQTTVIEGPAVIASGNQSIASNGHYTITSADANTADGTVRLTYDGNRALKAIDINTPQSSQSFDRDIPGHSFSCSGEICKAARPMASGLVTDAFSVGWDYQSFGIWAADTSATTWFAGAVSFGSPTAGNAIPLTGNPVFSGVTRGVYFDISGAPFSTRASMSASVDFGSQSIGFSTSNTTLVSGNTGLQTSNSGLDISGTLSYAQGVNAFSGPLRTANTLLNGQGSGRFYGPTAQEMGGVYALQGPGGIMFGGFGAKR